jgi:protein-L-isoaspartate(D-aspartate) O-methyltransferase
VIFAVWGLAASECSPGQDAGPSPPQAAARADERELDRRRQRLVEEILRREPEIRGTLVEKALRRVPRHRFVPPAWRELAYLDQPLPIGEGQTISQPSLVALMTRLADPQPGERALDVGTGSGYQAALLAEIVGQVESIEIVPALAEQARERLRSLGYTNVRVHTGDGFRGRPEQAPFDLIIVAAATPEIPPPLVEQLAPGGRLVLPLGDPSGFQDLVVVEKKPDGKVERRVVTQVRFVPMTGEARERRRGKPKE